MATKLQQVYDKDDCFMHRLMMLVHTGSAGRGTVDTLSLRACKVLNLDRGTPWTVSFSRANGVNHVLRLYPTLVRVDWTKTNKRHCCRPDRLPDGTSM